MRLTVALLLLTAALCVSPLEANPTCAADCPATTSDYTACIVCCAGDVCNNYSLCRAACDEEFNDDPSIRWCWAGFVPFPCWY